MKITKTQQSSKQPANQSKSLIIPQAYQLKHYPYDGILQRLAFMLVRPPRFIYNPDVLKPSKRISQKFTVQNHNIPFELTFYKQQNMKYVILYLHGNGSSRLQGTIFLPYLPERVGLACFDFNGCGNRVEREYITLGQEECKDVDIAAIFLKKLGYYVVGWGRSMGAVSLLMSNQCDLMVSDSAYSNLSSLCKQQSIKFLPKACCCIFHCIFPCVFACIECKVKSLAGLQMQNMDIAKRVQNIGTNKQICFIHGEQDTLIPYYHAQKLYNSFKGHKQLVLFQGTHNSTRNKQIISKCFDFIEEAIDANIKKQLNFSNNKLLEMENMEATPKIEPSQQKIQSYPTPQEQINIIKVNAFKPTNNQTQNHLNRQLKKQQKQQTQLQQQQFCEIDLNEAQLNKQTTLRDNYNTTQLSQQHFSSKKIKKSTSLLKIIPKQ